MKNIITTLSEILSRFVRVNKPAETRVLRKIAEGRTFTPEEIERITKRAKARRP